MAEGIRSQIETANTSLGNSTSESRSRFIAPVVSPSTFSVSDSKANHLLGISGRSRANLQYILRRAQHHASRIAASNGRRSDALANKTIVSLFFEDSTRTRLSFETAARRLSGDVMTFTTSTSSTKKGESIRDTVQTIDAMGVDAFVVRHSSPGVPWQMRQWTNAAIVNGGDGAHEHPTQSLIDLFALLNALGRNDLEGMRIAIVGDILHSRVARSNIAAFIALGATVTLVGPKTLLPINAAALGVSIESNLDQALSNHDVFYMLRIQKERATTGLFPSLEEYVQRFGLNEQRAARLNPDALIMHPGPMNRGTEIGALVADSAASLILNQVAAGVPVRMAVLELCLQGAIDNE